MTEAEIDVFLRALQNQYMDFQVEVRSVEQNSRLEMCFQSGEKRLCIRTPQGMDYRALDWREWLHRTAEVLAGEDWA